MAAFSPQAPALPFRLSGPQTSAWSGPARDMLACITRGAPWTPTSGMHECLQHIPICGSSDCNASLGTEGEHSSHYCTASTCTSRVWLFCHPCAASRSPREERPRTCIVCKLPVASSTAVVSKGPAATQTTVGLWLRSANPFLTHLP